MARPASRVSRVLMAEPLSPFADAYGLALCERGYTQRTGSAARLLHTGNDVTVIAPPHQDMPPSASQRSGLATTTTPASPRQLSADVDRSRVSSPWDVSPASETPDAPPLPDSGHSHH